MSGTTILTILAGVIVLDLIALAALFVYLARRNRSYDRLRRAAEGSVRPLPESACGRYERRMREVVHALDTDPSSALDRADRTIEDLAAERNFPAACREDEESFARTLHALEPGLAEEYREARYLRSAAERHPGEELRRRAVLSHVALVGRLAGVRVRHRALRARQEP